MIGQASATFWDGNFVTEVKGDGIIRLGSESGFPSHRENSAHLVMRPLRDSALSLDCHPYLGDNVGFEEALGL